MAKFEYVALDARGQETRGVLDGKNSNEVVAALRKEGMFPTSVNEVGKAVAPAAAKTPTATATPAAAAKAAAPAAKGKKLTFSFFEKKTVDGKLLMIFTRQLATLIDAGLPLLRGLDVLAKQEKDPVLKRVIGDLSEAVQSGSTFSEALGQHPALFNRLYVNMVKAGELGGVLEVVLNRLAEFQEKAQKLKNKVVSAMTYPVIVLSIAILILIFLLVFIVPKFEQIFKDLLGNKPLPWLTLMVMNASRSAVANWYLLLGGAGALVFGWKTLTGSEKGKAWLDRASLKAPLFGDLMQKSSISRFSRTLGTLITSGVPILQALIITRETAGNSVIYEAVTKVHDAVKEGETIVTPLEASGVFPSMVISMVDVGEETGQLPDMLLKVADVFDDEVDNTVDALTSLLEPLMIVFLAVIVGTIVIALFMPMVELLKNMSNPNAG
ncbi:MAG: type II secretion system F family protein [Verrucomicrobiota bacterium]